MTTEADNTASVTQESTGIPSVLTEFTRFPKLPSKFASRYIDMLCLLVLGTALEFRLFGHEHDAYVKDISLLSACSESRDTYLKFFDRSLRAGGSALIRFSKQDVIYIRNLWQIARYLPGDGKTLERIPCENLAGPGFCFWENYPGGFYSIADPAYVRSLDCWNDLKLISPVHSDESYYQWSGEVPEALMLETLRHTRRTKAMLKESGELSKEHLRNVELCVWDDDGSHIRLERDVAGEENSSTS